jgi:hypothetical protein
MNKEKPIELDCYLKYRCPSKNCYLDHWVSLAEAKTKNFIVVCSCGKKFKTKTVSKIKIQYKLTKKKKIKPIDQSCNDTLIPKDLLDKSVAVMKGLGFSTSESIEMLNNYYKHSKIDDHILLVKNTIAISNIGENL